MFFPLWSRITTPLEYRANLASPILSEYFAFLATLDLQRRLLDFSDPTLSPLLNNPGKEKTVSLSRSPLC